jgi:hypothetical protein
MPKLPRTKDEILDEFNQSPFAATNQLEQSLPLILEVLLDIRDNLEIPYLTEEQFNAIK